MYLLDTNVLSALGPARVATPGLAPWLKAHTSVLFLSVVTISEIESGIAKAVRTGATRKAALLEAWLDDRLRVHATQTIAFDLDAARLTGRMIDLAIGKGHTPSFPDIAIAATAQIHGLTVLTRNIRHFAVLDVPVHDPFVSLPAG